MESKHIKFDYENALAAKKQLLSMQLNLLQTEKKVRNYKILRKKEIFFKNLLKNMLRDLKLKINAERLTLPQEEESIKIKNIKKSIESKKQKDIKKQLEEIQEKLARLQ